MWNFYEILIWCRWALLNDLQKQLLIRPTTGDLADVFCANDAIRKAGRVALTLTLAYLMHTAGMCIDVARNLSICAVLKLHCAIWLALGSGLGHKFVNGVCAISANFADWQIECRMFRVSSLAKNCSKFLYAYDQWYLSVISSALVENSH